LRNTRLTPDLDASLVGKVERHHRSLARQHVAVSGRARYAAGAAVAASVASRAAALVVNE